jgi:plastocyanin
MKNFILCITLLCLTTTSKATVHIITCQNSPSHFLPIQVIAKVGDTILWKWVAGNHVVGPVLKTDIPTGAPTFDGIIDANHHLFEYVLKVAGKYTYDCHPAGPHGETATLVVSSTTVVNQLDMENVHFISFPNPSNGHFRLSIEGTPIPNLAKLEIVNLYGQSVYQKGISIGVQPYHDIYIPTKGIYFARLSINESIWTRKIIIE